MLFQHFNLTRVSTSLTKMYAFISTVIFPSLLSTTFFVRNWKLPISHNPLKTTMVPCLKSPQWIHRPSNYHSSNYYLLDRSSRSLSDFLHLKIPYKPWWKHQLWKSSELLWCLLYCATSHLPVLPKMVYYALSICDHRDCNSHYYLSNRKKGDFIFRVTDE